MMKWRKADRCSFLFHSCSALSVSSHLRCYHQTWTGIPLGQASSNLDTDDVQQLIDTIFTELERPREITAQVVKYLDGAYAVDRDAVPAFLLQELPKLEDYEHDL